MSTYAKYTKHMQILHETSGKYGARARYGARVRAHEAAGQHFPSEKVILGSICQHMHIYAKCLPTYVKYMPEYTTYMQNNICSLPLGVAFGERIFGKCT